MTVSFDIMHTTENGTNWRLFIIKTLEAKRPERSESPSDEMR